MIDENPRPASLRRRNVKPVKPRFVLCMRNEGYEVSLEKRKIYRVLPDVRSSAHRLIRLVDESGEDYLYPIEWFIPITLPQTAVRTFALETPAA